MSQYICCVPGCFAKKDSGIPLHRFPNPETNLKKFGIWVSNIGGEVLKLDMTYTFVNRRVCHNHFQDIYKYPKNRLSQLAIPTLDLQGEQRDPDRVDVAKSPVSDTLNMNQQIIKMDSSALGEQTDQHRVDVAKSPVPTSDDTFNMNQYIIIRREPSSRGSQKSYGVRQRPRKVKKMAGITEMEFTKYKKALEELEQCEVLKTKLKKKYFAINRRIKALQGVIASYVFDGKNHL